MEKERYYSPASEVMEFRVEGVIASSTETSATVSNPFSGNSEYDWSNE